MNPIHLNLPPGSECSNYLYQNLDIEDLTQDLLTVKLVTGFYIDVGWYPEHDPRGRYVIRVFHGTWDNQKLNRPITTRYVGEVVAHVEALARHYCRTRVPALQSSATIARPLTW